MPHAFRFLLSQAQGLPRTLSEAIKLVGHNSPCFHTIPPALSQVHTNLPSSPAITDRHTVSQRWTPSF
jgi:hypothetical protein